MSGPPDFLAVGEGPGPDARGRLSLAQVYAGDSPADGLLDESLHPRGPDVLFERAAELGVGSSSKVLDVGCRDARHLLELYRRFGCRGVGLELLAANLARAGTEVVAAPIELVCGAAQSLPFAGATFDLVWVRDVLLHVSPLVAALRECRRVLRPEGHVLIFAMFATDRLEPREAAQLWAPLAAVPENTDRREFEQAIASAGLQVAHRDDLSSEWREYGEEHGDGRTSRQLLWAARLLRDPGRFEQALGTAGAAVELANSLWGVYQMIGKLSPSVYVLR